MTPTVKTYPAETVKRRKSGAALDAVFNASRIAVIGASEKEGSVGHAVLRNLDARSKGRTIFPVNPNRPRILGRTSYPDVNAIGGPVDLAVIVTRAQTVPEIVRGCVKAGVRAAVVVSAGFREIGGPGAALEAKLRDVLRDSPMRLIGPNSLGVMNPVAGLNATLARKMARPGKVAFISQSGALCTAILDWSHDANIGFSAFVSVGSMVDVNWGDLIYYFGDDPNTTSILLYMESIGVARSFLSAAREVSQVKPIIVVKAGRTEPGARAAASHTGAMVGDDAAIAAAFERCGVLRVTSVEDLFHMADVLSKQPRPVGPNLAIVTNAGGPGVLAADTLISGKGKLAVLRADTIAQLDDSLPFNWSRNNPVDILGNASPKRFLQTTEIVARNPETDAILVILTPQAMTDPEETAHRLAGFAKKGDKPILACWMGGGDVFRGRTELNRAGIPVFSFPDTAARVFNYMCQHSLSVSSLYETPMIPGQLEQSPPNRTRAERIIAAAQKAGRMLLTEIEAKKILSAYGIPTVKTVSAFRETDALKAAERVGYPVVLKVLSEIITHKYQAGGVHLNLNDKTAVRRAFRAIKKTVPPGDFLGVTVQPMVNTRGFELILGSRTDEQLGPVLLFGPGGTLTELVSDAAFGLPPLNTTLARRMIESTAAYQRLQTKPDIHSESFQKLLEILVRFSYLVIDHPALMEIDINPLHASLDGLTALDARMILHAPGRKSLPEPAVTPYPRQYVRSFILRTGQTVTLRPIRPEDEPMMVEFHKTLSDQSVYFRYFRAMNYAHRVTHDRLSRICFVDYSREMALVAEYADPDTKQTKIIAVGRLGRLRKQNVAEYAIVISDACQRSGLGTELLTRLVEIGRDFGVDAIIADILPDNRGMQLVSERLGFKARYDADDQVVKVRLDLS